ncbi:MAG: aminoacyl-tRNA hydrolase [Rhodospirillales bacterium]|jgi:PTH1 family peptidyl-tRNA hydrolase
MLLAVGLGNPGTKYAGNRHNIGFMAINAIAALHGFPPWRVKFHAEITEGSLAGEPILLMKPTTYMNESGRAVTAAARFFKVSTADITVLYDELDLAPGKIRVKIGGGAAGHNGIRSIQSHIGPAFRRVRLGIGHPGDKDAVTHHVLADFAKAEQEWLERLLDGVAGNFPLLVANDDAAFMSKVAADIIPPRPKPTRKTNETPTRIISDTLAPIRNGGKP